METPRTQRWRLARATAVLVAVLGIGVSDADARTTQSLSPELWGLDRIDQRQLPLDGTYTYDEDGSGVDVYIFGTGVDATDPEFGNRVATGCDAVAFPPCAPGGQATSDCNGFGTFVAGVVGGTTFGVAKGVTIHPVRTLGCNGSGTWDAFEAGVYWVYNRHLTTGGPSVALLPFEAPGTTQLQLWVEDMVAAGIVVVTGAGNSNTDACAAFPAGVPSAITVAATTQLDQRAPFSNHGPCVDIFAPGQDIRSTTPSGVADWSGTHFAAAFVAGVAARILEHSPATSPAEVDALLLSAATTGAVTNPGPGSRDALLYSREDVRLSLDSPRTVEVIQGQVATYATRAFSAIPGAEITLDLEAEPVLPGAAVAFTPNPVAHEASSQLTISTSASTPTGVYELLIRGTVGTETAAEDAVLVVLPMGGASTTTYDNPTVSPIADLSEISSTIDVSDDRIILSLEVRVDITHTRTSDLIVRLRSPSGTETVLHNRAGLPNGIHRIYSPTEFDWQASGGPWTLIVSDNAGAEVGSLDYWSLTIRGFPEGQVSVPVAHPGTLVALSLLLLAAIGFRLARVARR